MFPCSIIADMITFPQLKKLFFEHKDAAMDVYNPYGKRIPAHYHITDIGAVSASFIDCGAQMREEKRVHIQLWLGRDLAHRIQASIFTNKHAI